MLYNILHITTISVNKRLPLLSKDYGMGVLDFLKKKVLEKIQKLETLNRELQGKLLSKEWDYDHRFAHLYLVFLIVVDGLPEYLSVRETVATAVTLAFPVW